MEAESPRDVRCLEADLRRCLTEWDSLHRIDLFPLGAHDSSDRLLIPEKLYGREPEIETLLTAFDRVVARGTPEVVLVSGYSGVGKSSVVNERHKALVPPRGLFAAGKFDQYERDIPYTTLAQEAAEETGVAIPFSCRQGQCGTCKTKLLAGNVRMDAEAGLDSESRAQGFVLTCVGRAEGRIKLDA